MLDKQVGDRGTTERSDRLARNERNILGAVCAENGYSNCELTGRDKENGQFNGDLPKFRSSDFIGDRNRSARKGREAKRRSSKEPRAEGHS
jgi:hypothetical protein